MLKKWFPFLMLVLLLFVVGTAFGLSSTNYRLDWFTLLDSGGGGPAQSTHYQVNATLGQTTIGSGHSTGFNTALGYWISPGSSARQDNMVYLPVILK
jgi:hypothetical protein